MLLVVGLVVSVGLVAMAPARAAFDRLDVDPAKYSGVDTVYVPTETMTITVFADGGDVYDLEIFRQPGGPATKISLYQFDDLTIPAAANSKGVQWTVPPNSPDSFDHFVGVYPSTYLQTGTGAPFDVYAFGVFAYNFDTWMDRNAYLPGDDVTAGWSATWIKDGSAAPAGTGNIQAWDNAGNLLATHNFNASVGSWKFSLSPTLPPDFTGTVLVWFNDTAGLHPQAAAQDFYVGALGVLATGGGVYAPGDVVTVNVWTKVTNPPRPAGFGDPAASGVTVNVTVIELTTGNAIAAYGATGLLSDAQGRVTHVFQLSSTAATGDYQAQVRADAYGTLSATRTVPFSVQSAVQMSVQVSLDRTAYVTGETIHAIAAVYRTTIGNYTYAWTVRDSTTGGTLAQSVGSASTFDFLIPQTYEGTLLVEATVNDGEGMTRTGSANANVAFGYLALSLDRSQYGPGETITATFSLRSILLTSPTYYVEVRDNTGNLAASGSTTSNSFSYTTPAPPNGLSSSYTFVVTAVQDGRSATGQATVDQARGYLLGVSLDKTSYIPGDVVRVHYKITSQGGAPLPAQFNLVAQILGAGSISAITTSAEGDLLVQIPQGANEGNLILWVWDTSTGAMAYETVKVGPTNVLFDTTLGGVPIFDVLLGLVVVLLVIAVLFLWRRTSPGAGVGKPAIAKPAPPPPPPGPSAGPAGPMSVACKHCGKSIEITTSKRPIEVMCPSCGETQLVQ